MGGRVGCRILLKCWEVGIVRGQSEVERGGGRGIGGVGRGIGRGRGRGRGWGDLIRGNTDRFGVGGIRILLVFKLWRSFSLVVRKVRVIRN